MDTFKQFVVESNFGIGPKGGHPKPGFHIKGMVYHVTPTEHVDTIKKEGIHPQPVEKRQWDTSFRRHEGGDHHVYAFTHPHRALEHAKRQASRTKKPQSVLAVKVPMEGEHIAGDWHMDPTPGMDRMGAIRSKTPVHKDNIVDVHHVKE